MSEAREATRGSGIRLATEAVSRALSVATTLAAMRLDPADFGVLVAVGGLAVVLAEAGDLGLQGLAVPALIARRFSLRDLLRAKLVLAVLLGGLALVLPLLLGGLAPVAAAVLPASWRQTVLAAGGGSFLLTPLILYYGLAGWSEFLGVALRAAGRRGQEAAVILCLRLSGLLATVLAIAAGARVWGLAWAQAASVVLPIVLGAWLLWLASRAAPDSKEAAVGSVLRAAAPLAVNGGLALVSLRIEVIAIFVLKGSREAGLFGAALKLVESLNGIGAALLSGALPSLTREALAGAGRSHQVRSRTAALVALLGVPAAVGMVLQAPGVLHLVAPPGYAGGAGALRILAFAIAVLFVNTLLIHALIAAGRADRLPRLTGVRVGVAVLLALTLVPALGGLGAAIGFLAAELLLAVLAGRSAAVAGFPVPVLRPVLLAALLSLPMAAVVGFLKADAVPAIAAGVGVYAVTLGAAWRVRRLRPLLEGRRD